MNTSETVYMLKLFQFRCVMYSQIFNNFHQNYTIIIAQIYLNKNFRKYILLSLAIALTNMIFFFLLINFQAFGF